jgi:hypothetical protein
MYFFSTFVEKTVQNAFSQPLGPGAVAKGERHPSPFC